MRNIVNIIGDVVADMQAFELLVAVEDANNLYFFTINEDDVQYWHVNARLIVNSLGVTKYGYVTAINNNILTVNLGETGLAAFDMFKMDINYRYGHPVDVFDQIQRMAIAKEYKLRRFPVIALMQDFDEVIEEGINETPIQIIFAVRTDDQYTASERYTNSFDGKRLTKLYERFIRYLRVNTDTYFRKQDITSKIDRLYWGREGALGNEEGKPYDRVDAIELNINLKTFENC